MRGSRCRDGTPLPVEGTPAALAVAAGRYFSVAIGTDGRAYAWGRCACGRGALASQPSKQPDTQGGDGEERRGLRTAGSAAAASDTGSVRHGNGRVAAIGGYQPYALGGGGVEHDRLVAVSAGYAHLLLLGASGTLYSCESGDDGYGGRLKTAPPHNAFGQLGRGGPPLVPLPIAGLRLAARAADLKAVPARFVPSGTGRLIAAGRCASFALDANGAVYSWGCAQANGHGGNQSSASALPRQLPRPAADVRAPLQLEALRGVAVRMLAAGEYHALALTSPCGLVAWGAAASGAGGAGGMVPVDGLPAAASGPLACEVLDIAAGYQHSLAVVRTSMNLQGVSTPLR
jgi:alpha-tubulin suppressor-like RCC1 family protein